MIWTEQGPDLEDFAPTQRGHLRNGDGDPVGHFFERWRKRKEGQKAVKAKVWQYFAPRASGRVKVFMVRRREAEFDTVPDAKAWIEAEHQADVLRHNRCPWVLVSMSSFEGWCEEGHPKRQAVASLCSADGSTTRSLCTACLFAVMSAAGVNQDYLTRRR